MVATGACSTSGKEGERGPIGSLSPARSGLGPMPDMMSKLREPITGATLTPPRTAT
ncbi:Uncharacterised protein [Mycobacteroides abscessus subsp. abscessus]|nr:Uncharacterised protein [Mycobacteroides abscessus subsp. abscessus]